MRKNNRGQTTFSRLKKASTNTPNEFSLKKLGQIYFPKNWDRFIFLEWKDLFDSVSVVRGRK